MPNYRTCDEIEQTIKDLLKDYPPENDRVRKAFDDLVECRKNEDMRNAIEFAVIIPKVDNSGVPFKRSVLDGYIDRVTRKFYGSTVFPDVRGCFISDEGAKLQCDENMIVVASVSYDNYPKIKEWMDDFTEQVGIELGQQSIYFTSDTIGRKFVPGKRRKRVPEKTVPIV
ncbi:MAG: hypothetical protein MUP55_00030 [Candidatus Aenigmarchaeota archaeon]|nr:hypothetical protein [Candidatus Aenigmarchaeota archaeon]